MSKSKRRKLLVIAALVGLVLWLGSSAWVAWMLTRRSGPSFAEPPPQVAWAKVEGHRLNTCDGQQIGAWLVRGDRQQGCVLLLHGNGASRGQMLPVMQMLAEAHFTVLAISLRAHGDSSGQINDVGWSRPARRRGGGGLPAAGVPGAARLHRGPLAGRRGGDLRGRRTGRDRCRIFPGAALQGPQKRGVEPAATLPAAGLGLGGLSRPAAVGAGVPAGRSRSGVAHDRLAEIPQDVPVVFLAGSADRHARLADVKVMYRRIESHAQLVVFEGAAHVALGSVQSAALPGDAVSLPGTAVARGRLGGKRILKAPPRVVQRGAGKGPRRPRPRRLP